MKIIQQNEKVIAYIGKDDTNEGENNKDDRKRSGKRRYRL